MKLYKKISVLVLAIFIGCSAQINAMFRPKRWGVDSPFSLHRDENFMLYNTPTNHQQANHQQGPMTAGHFFVHSVASLFVGAWGCMITYELSKILSKERYRDYAYGKYLAYLLQIVGYGASAYLAASLITRGYRNYASLK